ncbi:low-specificity L-threonine aldolase [Radiobacillus deserti]|uniref:Low-specificity L-threonine aldolase n=1 Tax=Radiobacillus deserti TaxID=2594883 RepID=A0A516KCC4_9BACI|nr:low-specificity L-threonine aldolase [Radiobacillus deserti]QDP39049.1 low-specificity L-threonine aldolase [Radiobacillus deserti]
MIDLRSDTVTLPSDKMRKAAYEAEVGDDVYGEDPSVNRLEEKAAEILGKEASLFVTSGTQGNQIAALTHCRPGQEIILEANAHIFLYEGAAISAFAGVQPRTIEGNRGAMDPREVEASIRAEDVHFPETGMICLENTHNKAGGAIVPIANMQDIYTVAQKHQIPVHLDGARLFNAAVASGRNVKDFAQYTDTIQFCLSKGLGAPVGSIIAGSSEFIHRARKWRKRLGGGLRQAGIIAAPGLLALQENINRLAEDHLHAKQLAEGLGQIEGLEVVNQVETNIVMIEITKETISTDVLIDNMKKHGVLAGGMGPNRIRFVTNLNISKKDIEDALSIIQKVL